MKSTRNRTTGILCILLFSAAANAQIDHTNWGNVTAPVFGVPEKAPYSAADLLAGPNKFGSYFSGVLPNGRIVKPAGTSVQVGMNPLGLALTADGRYLITSNDDERETGLSSLANASNVGGYSLSVVATSSMTVVSQISAGAVFVGLQVTGTGPYTVFASGGAENSVKLFTVSTAGTIAVGTPARITINSTLPANAGFVANYTPDAAFNTADANGNKPPAPSGFSRTGTVNTVFPAGSALSPDGRYLYVACNGDNSVAVIDTQSLQVVKQAPAGYFPYSVTVSPTGSKVVVSNWGETQYKFSNPTYDVTGKLTALAPIPGNMPDGFYVPTTDTAGKNPKTSSITILDAAAGNGAALTNTVSVYQGRPLDYLFSVGDTHPSATALVKKGSLEVLYVAKANDDTLGLLVLNNNRRLPDFNLAPVDFGTRPRMVGGYPNALAVSPDNTRLYVAEAGLNSVAVLDVSTPTSPTLLGRIPTGWYPSALAASPDGKYLYIGNAKGVGEDVNPLTDPASPGSPTGLPSFPGVDSNYIFGTVQQVDLSQAFDKTSVLANNFALNPAPDASVVPIGGVGSPSQKIKHVFFILKENKTFDSMLGTLGNRFGIWAATTYNDKTGKPYSNTQFNGVVPNTQTLATQFATAVNYYSDSEESDAGHQFAASGTATDYTEKTLLVKSGRGLLVNKNFEPEDYPASGYIFNNAARNGVSFKDYGALIRIVGTDTGTSSPTTLNDPTSGLAGYPVLQSDNVTVAKPLQNVGDTTSETQGLGQSYFMNMPVLAVLGTQNRNGEPRLDQFYPGYNFNISDQRRAQEFNADFDGMIADGTLPQFFYIYLPNDHTGSVQAPNKSILNTAPGGVAAQQVADGDAALGMIVSHIMNSPVYYDAAENTGSAIFITYDDAQSTLDHLHPHRTPLIVVSPFAKPAYSSYRHYSTASIVKTEELLLGLPPNNLGDLFATDLRDMFQPTYNGISASAVQVTRAAYVPTQEGRAVWALVSRLDTSSPDRDSARLGQLTRFSMQADELHRAAEKTHKLRTRAYRNKQKQLYEDALRSVTTGAPDKDDR